MDRYFSWRTARTFQLCGPTKELTTSLAADLQRVGVDVSLVPVFRDVLVLQVHRSDAQLAALGAALQDLNMHTAARRSILRQFMATGKLPEEVEALIALRTLEGADE